MSEVQSLENNSSPGLVLGIVSCVCAVVGFFIPLLGLVLAAVALVCGIVGFKAARAANYQAGIVLTLIGALVSGISLLVSLLTAFAFIGLAGGFGLFGAFH